MENNQVETEASPQETLIVKRIYVKTSTFESAALTDDLFSREISPTIDLQFQVNYNDRQNNDVEVIVTVIATAKFNANLLWRIQWQQAGIYEFKDFKNNEREFTIHQFCANQLYQYAVVHINTLIQQGGFPATILMPIDFGKLYQEKQNELQTQQPTLQ